MTPSQQYVAMLAKKHPEIQSGLRSLLFHEFKSHHYNQAVQGLYTNFNALAKLEAGAQAKYVAFMQEIERCQSREALVAVLATVGIVELPGQNRNSSR